LLDDLTVSQAQALSNLCESAEFEQIALSIAVAHYLRKCSAQAYSPETIKQQLAQLIRLAARITDPHVVSAIRDTLFDEVEKNVLSESARMLADSSSLPNYTRAMLVKHAAALAANATRNSELLSQLETTADILAFEADLRVQIANVHRSMRLPHAGISRQVAYDKLFVQPSIICSGDAETAAYNSLMDVLRLGLRVVLLGDPGGGKSTASLKLTHDIASGESDISYRTPFFVVLKDYAEEYRAHRTSIVDFLGMICQAPYAVTPPDGAIEYLLRNGSAIVVFDGLDELLATALRTDIVEAVEGFASRFPLTAVLVTSRKVGYDEAPLDSDTFLLANLDGFAERQVQDYAKRWFDLDESIVEPQRRALAKSFLADSDYVSDLRTNPLMLSLMCGLYSGERYIPKNRPDVYEKCANLLFERWDKQRGIVAPLPFDAHVQSSLRSLALWLYPQQELRRGLPRSEFVRFMTSYLSAKRFDDETEAEEAANEFIDFCRGRAWVLTDVGAEQYWFTHQTFLEFFAASQLVRENTSADRLFSQLWPRICQAEWDVVAQLAVQTLGKAVEDGADDFLQLVVDQAVSLDTPGERRNAVSFAARALAFVVPKPPVLRAIVEACITHHVNGSPSKESDRSIRGSLSASRPVIELGLASPENVPLIRKYAAETFTTLCGDAVPSERTLELALYWTSVVRPDTRIRASGGRATADEYRYQIELNNQLEDAVNRGAQHYSWVMAYLVEDGKRAVQELVDRFGIGALYECEYGGDVIDPPLAWKIIRGGDQWASPKGKFIDRSVIQGVHDALVSSKTPWFTFTRRMDPMATVVMMRVEKQPNAVADRLWRSTALLLALPVMEARTPSGRRPDRQVSGRAGNGAPHTRWVRTLPDLVAALGDRQPSIDSDAARYEGTELDRLRRFDVTEDASHIARDWIARRISLTGKPSPK